MLCRPCRFHAWWVVKKTVEDPQFEIVQKTVANPETVPQMQVLEKTTEVPQFRVADKVVDVLVVLVVQAPLVMAKTIQVSQLPFIKKIAVIPEIWTVPGTQTSESLNTAFLRGVTQGGNWSFVNVRAWLVCRHAAQHTTV